MTMIPNQHLGNRSNDGAKAIPRWMEITTSQYWKMNLHVMPQSHGGEERANSPPRCLPQMLIRRTTSDIQYMVIHESTYASWAISGAISLS
jgi:hypothetical protein